MKPAGELALLALRALLVLGAARGAAVPAVPADAAGLELTLLHVNDMHARYEQTSAFSGACSAQQAQAGQCYGGHARVATIIKQSRKNDEHVLVLNAGDTFQGTVYYSLFKWNISAEFINLLDFDALTLGNHEFDDQADGLVPFLRHLKKPVIVANVDFSQEPAYAGLDIKRSVVLERGGAKIGVIGYLTPDTPFLSSPGKVSFSDEIEALKAEAALLKQQGVDIIIGLGHSGYEKDKQIAAQVPDIDLVVGGHSHSFLYTGPQPDTEVPVGLYPTYVKQDSGRRVPVVQAYAFTKYMGKLRLKFDARGELTDLEGGPLLLNKDVEEDPDTLQAVMRWKAELDGKVLQPLGRASVLLDGSTCRAKECNLGNLVADSFVMGRAAESLKLKTGWTDAAIALVNAGAIRTSINASAADGVITIKDVMEVMPFDNLQVLLRLRGHVLLEALEHAVSEYVVGAAWKGQFLQMSGLRVAYDVNQVPGSRVASVLVRCANCTIPAYSALQPNALYGVITSSFMANGGDGFSMLADNEGATPLGDTDSGAVQNYIRKRQLVYPGVEGRLSFVNLDASTTTSASTSSSRSSSSRAPPATTPSSSARVGAPLLTCLPLLGAALAALAAPLQASR